MEALKNLFRSKKFLASLAGLIGAVLASTLNVGIPNDVLLGLLGVIAAYVIGQGVSDHGKEAAAIHAEVEREKIAGVKDGTLPT